MTIPASQIVQVNPVVIGTGGSPLSMNLVLLTDSTIVPTESILPFVTADAVGDYFGLSSVEKELADVYFLGYRNSFTKPGTLIIAPYAAAARAAWLMSGRGLTLAQVKAASAGTIIVTIDGHERTTESVNLASSESLSAAAATLQTAIRAAGATTATVEWNATTESFVLTSSTTGDDSTISYASGTLAASLKMTEATGAIISQGRDIDTPATALDSVTAITHNWATFTTTWEPEDAEDKVLFAEWSNSQNQRYLYIAWDTDSNAIVANSASTFGAIAKAAEYNGVCAISGSETVCASASSSLEDEARKVAVFLAGAIASINFAGEQQRITTAFKSQGGLISTVDDAQTAANLLGNGYNFYATYGTANDDFTFFYNGQMPGIWKWIDTYVNQIYLNQQLQLALMTLLTESLAVPYNHTGYAKIRSAMDDPIRQMKNFGGIQDGIQLSELQKALINEQAGTEIDAHIYDQGYSLQVKDPGAQARGLRQSPIVILWYTDGGAVHQINVASVDVQ
jgi:hypothetical protein